MQLTRLPHIPFKNEPLRDFSEEFHRNAISLALNNVERMRAAGQLKAAPLIHPAENSFCKSLSVVERYDPSDLTQKIGTVTYASKELAERVVSRLVLGFQQWRDIDLKSRCTILRNAAAIMRSKKAFLTALIIREVGKPWKEADADVAEAIDFCEYYASAAEVLLQPSLTEKLLGEENIYFYQARGVVAVIAPWNFPLAIACGMTVAALVTGNSVCLKPAEQSSIVAQQFGEILYTAGVPRDVLSVLPGEGEIVGKALTEHSAVAMITFTGSRAVGFEIIKSAAEIRQGQRAIKRVVAELGGKNCIVVDEDADADDALRGILSSTFGFAGQKCSACSRVIIVGKNYEALLARLSLAVSDVIVGKALDPSCYLGPVVDLEAAERIRSIIANCKKELSLLVEHPFSSDISNSVPLEPSCYIPPIVFRDVPTNHSLWRDEVFGPVLACRQAATFQEAINLACDTEYALTGGVFSRQPSHLEYARKEFRVGNLYLNRSITGALVGRQPFGGFGFSGVGSKAGGADYLLQFVEPRVVTENSMRRGFTPDLS